MKDFQKYSTKKKHIMVNNDDLEELWSNDVSMESSSVNYDCMSVASSSNKSAQKAILRNSSIVSLPAKQQEFSDKIPRCTSLVTLNQKEVPTQKERFLLNQYLQSIKEESDENFRKFKEKSFYENIVQQEDVMWNNDEAVDKKVGFSLIL